MQSFFTIRSGAIKQLKGCSYPTARKEYLRVRHELSLDENEPLKLCDLATVWCCPVQELAEVLYLAPRKKPA
jgi:hypothetical protein